MCGKRGQDTHVWLEQGDYVIDITGDQFADYPHGPVYVGRDRLWFTSFAGVDSGKADYRHIGGSIEAELNASYAFLIKSEF